MAPTSAPLFRQGCPSRAFKLDVLRVEDGKIAEITTFDASLFPAFGLPPTL
jgi:ketosteroid isomerase-like protein